MAVSALVGRICTKRGPPQFPAFFPRRANWRCCRRRLLPWCAGWAKIYGGFDADSCPRPWKSADFPGGRPGAGLPNLRGGDGGRDITWRRPDYSYRRDEDGYARPRGGLRRRLGRSGLRAWMYSCRTSGFHNTRQNLCHDGRRPPCRSLCGAGVGTGVGPDLPGLRGIGMAFAAVTMIG